MGSLFSSEKSPSPFEIKKGFTNIYPSPTAEYIRSKCQPPIKPAPQHFQKIDFYAQSRKKSEIVTAFDGRIQVLTTAQWPYSVHGVIVMKFKNMTSWGTGTLIGPNVVLTAGHNLYNYDDKIYAELESMQFLPGMNGQLLPFGVIEVEKYLVSPNYIKEQKEDYGILILKKPIGEITGYFGLACLDPEGIKQKRINVTGYPGDKVASKSNTYEMWTMNGEAAHIDKDRGLISYLIDTAEGQNGSAVYYQEGEDYFVVGVHVLGGHFVNQATFLDRKAYEQIFQWIQASVKKEWLFTSEKIKSLESEPNKEDPEHISPLPKETPSDSTSLNQVENKTEAEEAKMPAEEEEPLTSVIHSTGSAEIKSGSQELISVEENTENLDSPNKISKEFEEENQICSLDDKDEDQTHAIVEKKDRSEDEAEDIEVLMNRRKCNQTYKWLKQKVNKLLSRRGSGRLEFMAYRVERDDISVLLKYDFDDPPALEFPKEKINGEGVEQLLRTQFLQLNFNCHEITAKKLETIAYLLAGSSKLNTLSLNSKARKHPSRISWSHPSLFSDKSLETSEFFLSLNTQTIRFQVAELLPANLSQHNFSNFSFCLNSMASKGPKVLQNKGFWAEILLPLFQENSSFNSICSGGETAPSTQNSWNRQSLLETSFNYNLPYALNNPYSSLTRLVVRHQIGDEEAILLANSQSLPNLRELILSNNNIGNSGAIALASSHLMNRLQCLNLSQNQIGEAGRQAFEENPVFLLAPEFGELNFNRNENEGISQNSPHNVYVFLHGNRSTEGSTQGVSEQASSQENSVESAEELDREVPNESGNKYGLMTQEESSAHLNLVIGFPSSLENSRN